MKILLNLSLLCYENWIFEDLAHHGEKIKTICRDLVITHLKVQVSFTCLNWDTGDVKVWTEDPHRMPLSLLQYRYVILPYFAQSILERSRLWDFNYSILSGFLSSSQLLLLFDRSWNSFNYRTWSKKKIRFDRRKYAFLDILLYSGYVPCLGYELLCQQSSSLWLA